VSVLHEWKKRSGQSLQQLKTFNHHEPFKGKRKTLASEMTRGVNSRHTTKHTPSLTVTHLPDGILTNTSRDGAQGVDADAARCHVDVVY